MSPVAVAVPAQAGITSLAAPTPHAAIVVQGDEKVENIKTAGPGALWTQVRLRYEYLNHTMRTAMKKL